MTTGSYSVGTASTVGPVVNKSWTGGNWPLVMPRKQKWKDLPPLKDAWGHTIDPKKDRLEYAYMLRVAKGKSLRVQRTRAAANGSLELHNYTKTHTKAFNTRITTDDFRSGTYLSYGFGHTWTDPWSANDEINVIQKLREKLVGSDLNMAVSLAEVDKTYRMLGGNLTNLAWGISSLAKGDLAAAFQWLFRGERARKEREISPLRGLPKGVANLYLWWIYGVRPLIDDTDALMRYLAWQEASGSPVARVRARRRLKLDVKSTSSTWVQYDPSFTYGWSGMAITAYLYDVNVPALVGLYDIPSLLYERTMYSFVLDWVIPIGAYLDARTVSSALTGNFVKTRRVYGQSRPTANSVKISGVTYTGLSGAWQTYHWMQRTVVGSLDAPFPTIKPVRKIVTAIHASQAAALLTSKLKFLA